jgi:hypothetical protein
MIGPECNNGVFQIAVGLKRVHYAPHLHIWGRTQTVSLSVLRVSGC